MLAGSLEILAHALVGALQEIVGHFRQRLTNVVEAAVEDTQRLMQVRCAALIVSVPVRTQLGKPCEKQLKKEEELKRPDERLARPKSWLDTRRDLYCLVRKGRYTGVPCTTALHYCPPASTSTRKAGTWCL